MTKQTQIIDGWNNLLAATIHQALRDMSARELERRLDAILFLMSPVAEDYLTLLDIDHKSVMGTVFEAGKRKRFMASADIIALVADLSRNQRIMWRQTVLEELPRIRQRVLQATKEELARAVDKHSQEGLEAIVEPSERFF
ncbi:MAG: hypothetical protein ACOY16_09210 [Chloroflexota bacterium]